MNDRTTGLDPVENAILATLLESGASDEGPLRKTSLVLDDVNERHRFAPDDSYARILGLCRPWLTGLRLIEFNGNAGARSFEAAEAKYTEVRLTPLGTACAHALEGTGPAVPVGLVLGDTYKGGRRPPLHAGRLADALRAAQDGDDAEVLVLVGPPSFPDDCSVEGDLDALARGLPVRLRLTAQVTPIGEHAVRIDHLPPGSSESDVYNSLRQIARDVPIRDVDDRTTSAGTELVVRIKAPGTAADVIDPIQNIWGVHRTMDCQHPRPLAELLRTWVRDDPHQLDGLRYLVSD